MEFNYGKPAIDAIVNVMVNCGIDRNVPAQAHCNLTFDRKIHKAASMIAALRLVEQARAGGKNFGLPEVARHRLIETQLFLNRRTQAADLITKTSLAALYPKLGDRSL